MVPSNEPSSSLIKVLNNAEKDMENAEWDGILARALHPLKNKIVLPSLRFASKTMAGASDSIPSSIDAAAGAVVGATCEAIKFGYGVLPHEPSLGEFAVQEIEATSLGVFNRLPNQRVKYESFLATVKMFLLFLCVTGIDNKLAEAFLSPNAITNMLLTARIQASLEDTRKSDAMFCIPPVNKQVKQELLKESERYLKYSTAAYGTFQISASNAIQVQPFEATTLAAGPFDDAIEKLQDKFKKRIAKYLDLKQEHILHMTPINDNTMVIPHFVAIDHNSKAVVLAIRGTNSLSDIFTDLKANTAPFCGGVAHQGMFEKMHQLLEYNETIHNITAALEEHRDYELILTGHSLGAGIAGLLHMHLHYHGYSLLQKCREARFFGFGCPPVFDAPVCSPSMQEIVGFQRLKTAISKTYCFINRHDIVPFLSVDSVRRLAETLLKVDACTEKLNPVERLMLIRGLKDPSEDLVKIVEEGSKCLDPVSGAERLKIPGRYVLWMDSAVTPAGGAVTSRVTCCRPSYLSTLSIRLSDQFVFDHLPPRYEKRIHDIIGE